MATNSSNLPNTVPGAAATSATFPTYMYDHQLRGLPSSVPVYSDELGPEHPASLTLHIRGTWRELKFWWRHYAKHIDTKGHVAEFVPSSFTSPPSLTQPAHTMPRNHPYTIRREDYLSICEECSQLLSRRSCNGKTVISYQGCDFHLEHPDIPFAYRCRETRLQQSNFFRQAKEMFWNRETLVTTYYLSKNPFPEMGPIVAVLSGVPVLPVDPSRDTTQSTDGVAEAEEDLVSLEHVPFLHRYREISERANLPRVEYLHTDSCLHGSNPDCIVQGSGVAGLYYKRCDGRFVNALGDILGAESQPPSREAASPPSTSTSNVNHNSIPPQPPLTTSLRPPSAALAELAWRRHHPTAGPNSWSEIKAQRKRLEVEEAAARRAEKRATLVSRAGEWVRRRKQAVRARKQSVVGKVGGWCRERTGFWGA